MVNLPCFVPYVIDQSEKLAEGLMEDQRSRKVWAMRWTYTGDTSIDLNLHYLTFYRFALLSYSYADTLSECLCQSLCFGHLQ